MEITRQKNADLLVIRLAGRLDANWCGHVQNALAGAVRDGEHRIHLDMSAVTYVSSAGLRVLLSLYKQLRAINGHFGVINASLPVNEVLELAGLGQLLVEATVKPSAASETGTAHASPRAQYEIFPPAAATGRGGVKLSINGRAELLGEGGKPATIESVEFDATSFALGVGALGTDASDCAPRFGEFLALRDRLDPERVFANAYLRRVLGD